MNIIKTERGTIAGGISVLMIFLTLCIVIYGLISLLTARNELSLNLKNREAATNYFTADMRAVTIISELTSMQERSEVSDIRVNDISLIYDSTTDTAYFVVPVDQYRNLDVSVTFIDEGSQFVLNRYRVVNNLNWQDQIDSKITVLTEFE